MSTLYLIPTDLGSHNDAQAIPYNKHVCNGLDCFIIENIKSARRYLRRIGFTKNFDEEVSFFELNKHGFEYNDLFNFIQARMPNKNFGLLSDAGNPCIADPGAVVVETFHQLGLKVKPLIGPSSILLALISSGFNGQQFTFHGYVPIDEHNKRQFFKRIESSCKKSDYTQIFMDTPYRNNKLKSFITQNCDKNLRLCIAADLTLDSEFIKTQSIQNWKLDTTNLNKRPAIFLIHK